MGAYDDQGGRPPYTDRPETRPRDTPEHDDTLDDVEPDYYRSRSTPPQPWSPADTLVPGNGPAGELASGLPASERPTGRMGIPEPGYPAAGHRAPDQQAVRYPAPQYPATQYPGTQYPGSQYPGTWYPENPYPGTRYPASDRPGREPAAPHDPLLLAPAWSEAPPLDPPEPAGERARTPGRTWQGTLEPYLVGPPGDAANGRSRVDPDMPYRPDTALDGSELVDDRDRVAARVRAASVRGLSHRYSGKTRQDDYALRQTDDRRYLVAVVADGVSAGRHSHRAAALATQRGADLLVKWLDQGPPDEVRWDTLVSQLAGEIHDLGKRLLAREEVSEPTDREIAKTLATTALFAIVDLGAPGPLPVSVLAVGDSSAWVLRDGRSWEAQQPIKNDGEEIASSATDALPRVHGPVGPPIRTELDRDDVLILVTDGIGDPLQDGENDFGDFLAEKWATPPSRLDFAAQVDFARKSFDDDRTAVAVWPGA